MRESKLSTSLLPTSDNLCAALTIVDTLPVVKRDRSDEKVRLCSTGKREMHTEDMMLAEIWALLQSRGGRMQRKKTGGLTPFEMRTYMPLFSTTSILAVEDASLHVCRLHTPECLPLSDECDIQPLVDRMGEGCGEHEGHRRGC